MDSALIEVHASRGRSATIARRFLLWLIICSLSAAPSFILARMELANIAGMALGVMAFVLVYTFLTSTRRFDSFYRKRYIRGTMRFGYGTRLVLSLLGGLAALPELKLPLAFPLFPDLFCGAISLNAGGYILGRGSDADIVRTLEGAFLVTCIQGAILNVLIFLAMAIVYTFRRVLGRGESKARGFEVIPLAEPVDPATVKSGSSPQN